MTEYRKIEGFEDYEVGSDGSVWSLKNRKRKQMAVVIGSWGRQYTMLYNKKKRSSQLVHRLVANAFLGKQPSDKHEVCHNNGIPTDNRVENLRWDIHVNNLADKVLHKTNYGARGELHGKSKLTAEQVLEIRKFCSQGKTAKYLANTYKV